MGRLRAFVFFVIVLGASKTAWAAGSGGSYAIGGYLGVVNSEQSQINELISRANIGSSGPISTSSLNSAYEGALFFMYRFTGTIYALQFRPSYFYQVQDGSGSAGTYKYDLQGFTLFPLFRVYPLENDFMRFYMQLGLGYGRLNGKIQEGSANAAFAGGAFGTMLGLGTEFCFSPNHCLNVEGNYRYLTIERNIVSSSSGSFAATSLSQYAKGDELEMDNSDISTRMGGLIFMAGYSFWF